MLKVNSVCSEFSRALVSCCIYTGLFGAPACTVVDARRGLCSVATVQNDGLHCWYGCCWISLLLRAARQELVPVRFVRLDMPLAQGVEL